MSIGHSVDGKLAFRPMSALLQEIFIQDPGLGKMPPIAEFLAGRKLPLVVMLDATGYGSQQLNTIALRNPNLSASSHNLRILGLGNCSDNRSGSTSLLGDNLPFIN